MHIIWIMSNLMANERTPLISSQKTGDSNNTADGAVGGDFVSRYILRINRNDDHISSCTKRLTILSVAVVLLWVTSFILVMIQIIDEHETPSHKLSTLDWPLFVPMWLGSALGICGACHISFLICHNATLTSRERRTAVSLSASAPSASERNYIDFDSLPLLRRLLGYLLTFTLSLVLCLATQILYYLWFIHSYLSVWHATIPTFTLLFLYTAYMYSMSVFDTWSCCTISLLVAELPLFTLHLDGSIHLPRAVLLAPFVAGAASGLLYYAATLCRLLAGHLVASWWQWISLSSLILSLVLMLLPAVTQVFSPLLVSSEMFLVAVPLATFALVLALFAQGTELAETRGYSNPLVLMQDEEGAWVPAAHGNAVSVWLLGDMAQSAFEVKQAVRKDPVANKRNEDDGTSQDDRRLRSSEIELTSHVKK